MVYVRSAGVRSMSSPTRLSAARASQRAHHPAPMKRATLGRLLRHLVALAALAVGPPAAAGGPPSGTLLGPGTAALARGFLPEEILARYRAGEFLHEVMGPRPARQGPAAASWGLAGRSAGGTPGSGGGAMVRGRRATRRAGCRERRYGARAR